jgi:hypothetical protein
MINPDDYLYKQFRLKENNSEDYVYYIFYDYGQRQGINYLYCIVCHTIDSTTQGTLAPDYTNLLNEMDEVEFSDEIKQKMFQYILSDFKWKDA